MQNTGCCMQCQEWGPCLRCAQNGQRVPNPQTQRQEWNCHENPERKQISGAPSGSRVHLFDLWGFYLIYLQDWSSHKGKGVSTKTGRVQDKCWEGGVISGQVQSPTRQKVWSKLWFGASVLWLVLEKTVICCELSCKNCDLPDKCWRGKRDLGCDSNSEITTLGLRPSNAGSSFTSVLIPARSDTRPYSPIWYPSPFLDGLIPWLFPRTVISCSTPHPASKLIVRQATYWRGLVGIHCGLITIYELLVFSVDSLRKLHRKMTSIDASPGDHGDLISTRRAWGEIIDNVDRGKAFRTSFFLSLQMSPRVSNQRVVLR